MPLELQVGEIVQMKKSHACGENRWQVYRVGADIGLRCLHCNRRQLMPRRKFEKAFKRKLEADPKTNHPNEA
jgi:hypothetical protein